MTEPDEALIWARERAARWAEGKRDFVELAPSIRLGKWDLTLKDDADAYRAGQAASAERIKALEALLRHLRQWDQMNPPMTGDHAAHAASIDALLKEADQ
jgi:hypothetical protein